MAHVLLVSIGPVQDFIATARRCRDLWFGSWLLSDLAKAAARGVVNKLDGKIEAVVFPGAKGVDSLKPGSNTSVANKILARVEGGPEIVKAAAAAAEKEMQSRLHAIRDVAFEKVGRGDPHRSKHFMEATARQQVDDLMEFTWVAVEEAEGDYAGARKEAERLLAARKNTKVWSQPAWSAPVPKSSLDGVRESVIHEDVYTERFGQERRRQCYGVHSTERLCGVGLLKRLGRRMGETGKGTEETFASTSHMAALSYMRGASAPSRSATIEPEWKEFVRALKRSAGDDVMEPLSLGHRPNPPQNFNVGFFKNVDGSVLFEERLDETLEECGRSAEQRKAAREALRTFLRNAGLGEPNPYYAILLADGDKMGTVIDAQRSFEAHRELSKKLDGFATRAEVIVEKHDGCLLYSGGDDVLALLPLHEAVACAKELSDDFADALKEWKAGDSHATLSVGLAVVHHLEPLEQGRAAAARAEKLAKVKRNSLAVIVSKRSGGDTEISGEWKDIDERLEKLMAICSDDGVSAKAGYELAQLRHLVAKDLPGAPHKLSDDEKKNLEEVQKAEARRILSRKRSEHGSEFLDAATREFLGGVKDPAALGDELYVAKLIASARKLAGEGAR